MPKSGTPYPSKLSRNFRATPSRSASRISPFFSSDDELDDDNSKSKFGGGNAPPPPPPLTTPRPFISSDDDESDDESDDDGLPPPKSKSGRQDFIPSSQTLVQRGISASIRKRRLFNVAEASYLLEGERENVLPPVTATPSYGDVHQAKRMKQSSLAHVIPLPPKLPKKKAAADWRDHPRQNPSGSSAVTSKKLPPSQDDAELPPSQDEADEKKVVPDTPNATDEDDNDENSNDRVTNPQPTDSLKVLMPQPLPKPVASSLAVRQASNKFFKSKTLPEITKKAEERKSSNVVEKKTVEAKDLQKKCATKVLTDLTNTAQKKANDFSATPTVAQRELRKRSVNPVYNECSPPAAVDLPKGLEKYDLPLEDSYESRNIFPPKKTYKSSAKKAFQSGDAAKNNTLWAKYKIPVCETVPIVSTSKSSEKKKSDQPVSHVGGESSLLTKLAATAKPDKNEVPKKAVKPVPSKTLPPPETRKRKNEKELPTEAKKSPVPTNGSDEEFLRHNDCNFLSDVNSDTMMTPTAESTRCHERGDGGAHKLPSPPAPLDARNDLQLKDTPRTRAHASPARGTKRIVPSITVVRNDSEVPKVDVGTMTAKSGEASIVDVGTMTESNRTLEQSETSCSCQALRRSVEVIVHEEIRTMIRHEFYELCKEKAGQIGKIIEDKFNSV